MDISLHIERTAAQIQISPQFQVARDCQRIPAQDQFGAVPSRQREAAVNLLNAEGVAVQVHYAVQLKRIGPEYQLQVVVQREAPQPGTVQADVFVLEFNNIKPCIRVPECQRLHAAAVHHGPVVVPRAEASAEVLQIAADIQDPVRQAGTPLPRADKVPADMGFILRLVHADSVSVYRFIDFIHVIGCPAGNNIIAAHIQFSAVQADLPVCLVETAVNVKRTAVQDKILDLVGIG